MADSGGLSMLLTTLFGIIIVHYRQINKCVIHKMKTLYVYNDPFVLVHILCDHHEEQVKIGQLGHLY